MTENSLWPIVKRLQDDAVSCAHVLIPDQFVEIHQLMFIGAPIVLVGVLITGIGIEQGM